MTGAAVRFYVVCMILQRFVLDAYGIPFPVTVVGTRSIDLALLRVGEVFVLLS